MNSTLPTVLQMTISQSETNCKQTTSDQRFKMEQKNSQLELSPLLEKPVHKQYSRTEVSNHCDSSSCWIVLDNKIYDVTKFLSKHPGGPDIILENAGRDATVPFKDKGHSMEAIRLIDQYYIGDLTVNDRLGRH